MSWVSNIDELFRKLKPVLGEEKLRKLWLAYQTRTDPRSRSEILGYLNVLAAEHLNDNFDRKILLDVPPAELICGDYPIGRIIHGEKEYHPFALREKEWIQHIGVFGRSGSGKTNAVFVLLWHLLDKKKPFLVFDWKRNYRDILFPKNDKNIKIYTIGRSVNPFFFNPLIPPKGTDPQVWLKKLIEIMCHAYFLGEGVSYLL